MIKDARGELTRFNYDTQGNPAQTVDALGGVKKTTFDSIGRSTSVTNPNGHTTRLIYDANSQLVEIIDPLGHTTRLSYDAVGNVRELADAKGDVTQYRYDEVNNLAVVINELGHRTSYSYDANNNLIGLTNGNGHTSTYGFDGRNRRTAIRNPLGYETNIAYDPQGNIVGITDANGNKNSFSYDADSLLTKIMYADGSSVGYSYDANGNRVNMEDQRGQTSYTYDGWDQMSEIIHPDGSVVRYEYDAVGNRTRLTYPDGKTTYLYYDALSRLSQVQDRSGRATHYTYDAAGNLLRTILPNNTTISNRYDAAEQLLSVINTLREEHRPDSFVPTEFAYTLDPLGNRVQTVKRDRSGKALETSYAYDALSQLVAVQERLPGAGRLIKDTEYSYDAVGNRLSQTTSFPGDDRSSEGRSRTQYSYNAADQLLRAGGTTYTYDANGNRLTKADPIEGRIVYGYDAVDRLVRVGRPTTEVAYTYDGDGNKIEETVTRSGRAETLRFLNDAATALPVLLQQERVTADGLLETRRYVYGLDPISEELSSPLPHLRPQTFFYHVDGLGSTVALTDPVGTVRAHYQYEAWGQLKRSDGHDDRDDRWGEGIANRFLFTGQERDPYTDLYYLRARWYDPAVGRFLTTDPACGVEYSPQNLNAYIYALNNPINLIDPSGEWPSWVKKAARAVRAFARNPYGGAAIRLVIAGAGCLGGTALGNPVLGCAAGFGIADLALAGLRGEFECKGQLGKIFARAGVQALVGAAVGYFNPSPPLTGEYLYRGLRYGAPTLVGDAAVELYSGTVLRAMGAGVGSQMGANITRCNPDPPEYHDPSGPTRVTFPLTVNRLRPAK